MDVYFRKFENDAFLPILGSPYSSGYDFFALDDVIIPAHDRFIIRTGVGVAWSDPNSYLQLFSRSGLFANHGITCEGGVIDYDFLKPISVLLQNHSADEYKINKGDRICQGIFLQRATIVNHSVTTEWHRSGTPYFPFTFGDRNGGLGSTGK